MNDIRMKNLSQDLNNKGFVAIYNEQTNTITVSRSHKSFQITSRPFNYTYEVSSLYSHQIYITGEPVRVLRELFDL